MAFKENYQKLLQDNAELEEIIFNFEQTTFIDSSGVGVLVSNYKQAKAKEVKLSLNGVTAPVMAVLSLTGLDKVFEIKSLSKATDDQPLQVAAHPSVRSRLKRFIDILGAIFGLLITSILYIPIAIAIKLEDNGSVLFSQTRCGWMGREFQLYKFRTMGANTPELEDTSKNLTKKQVFTSLDDPRITGVGRFLRKTGLDELPQFWNVLKGEMSLVGTRPPTPDEVDNYEIPEWRRLNVKPGMTGEWKVKERTQIQDFQDIIKLDLDYQQHWGLLHDLKLIINTILVVFKRVFAFNRKQEAARNEQ
jgi:anti-anti-sigma factor